MRHPLIPLIELFCLSNLFQKPNNHMMVDAEFLSNFSCSCKRINFNDCSQLVKSQLVGFPSGLDSKESACNAGDPGTIPGSGRSPKKEMATYSIILAWKIPWTEEPSGLQSMGSQRVGHDWATNTHTNSDGWPIHSSSSRLCKTSWAITVH